MLWYLIVPDCLGGGGGGVIHCYQYLTENRREKTPQKKQVKNVDKRDERKGKPNPNT